MLTIGHGTHTADEFISLLRRNDVRVLVDVRAFPRSRHNPQFNRDVLEATIPDAGIGYRWAEALGGRRRPKDASPNTALRHPAFRAYADYMGTDAFWRALDDALRDDDGAHTAVMCSESLWWRCHRRLIADAVALVRVLPVWHIMPDGKVVVHVATDGVRRNGDNLIYDRESQTAD